MIPVLPPKIEPTFITFRVPTQDMVLCEGLHIPAGITNLESFRAWTRSADFPRVGRIEYDPGRITIDTSRGRRYPHIPVKVAIDVTLLNLDRELESGMYHHQLKEIIFPPDQHAWERSGVFVSYGTLASGRIRRLGIERDGTTIFAGTPDMVLEVVSDYSEDRDAAGRPDTYHRAGVPEFWRVDARGESLVFEILRLTDAGYVSTPEPDGWWRSAVFGRSFRLERGTDPLGDPTYTLHVRA